LTFGKKAKKEGLIASMKWGPSQRKAISLSAQRRKIKEYNQLTRGGRQDRILEDEKWAEREDQSWSTEGEIRLYRTATQDRSKL